MSRSGRYIYTVSIYIVVTHTPALAPLDVPATPCWDFAPIDGRSGTNRMFVSGVAPSCVRTEDTRTIQECKSSAAGRCCLEVVAVRRANAPLLTLAHCSSPRSQHLLSTDGCPCPSHSQAQPSPSRSRNIRNRISFIIRRTITHGSRPRPLSLQPQHLLSSSSISAEISSSSSFLPHARGHKRRNCTE